MSSARTWSLVVLGASAPRTGRVQQLALDELDRRPRRTTIAEIPVADRSPAGTSGKEPTVTVPTGAPPHPALESADLIVGTGPAAKPGDTVTVQYVLATYSSGKEIQSSWTSQPFTFTLDASAEQVIPGWDEGRGRHAGGRAARADHPAEPGLRGQLAGRGHRRQRHPGLHGRPAEDQLSIN